MLWAKICIVNVEEPIPGKFKTVLSKTPVYINTYYKFLKTCYVFDECIEFNQHYQFRFLCSYSKITVIAVLKS